MATNDPNFPDPSGPPPPGVDPGAWYGYTTVDSSKPLSQWTSWVAEGKYDPTATGYARFKSSKVDANGNPIQGDFEHPDACPDGTTAFGKNQCISTNDPRIQAAWGTGPGGANAPGASGSAAAPPPPPPTWGANGSYNASGGGDNANATKTSPLQGMLQDMFTQRTGALFNPGGQQTSGSLGIDGNGNALPITTADTRQARSLGGGGLLWTQDGTGLNSFGPQTPAKPQSIGGSGGGGQNTPASLSSTISNMTNNALAPKQPVNPNVPPPNAPGPAAGVNLSDYLAYQKQQQAGTVKQQQGQQQTKASTLTPTPFPMRNGAGSAAGY